MVQKIPDISIGINIIININDNVDISSIVNVESGTARMICEMLTHLLMAQRIYLRYSCPTLDPASI